MNAYSGILLSLLMMAQIGFSDCGSASIKNDSDRNIVYEFGYKELMGYMIADVNNLEAICEISSQVIQCDVLSVDNVIYTDNNLFNFEYTVEIENILLDTSSQLNVGDKISVTSNEGVMKAADAADMIASDPRSIKLGILQGEYGDNDYITCSTWDAIPIETGKSYIMFITDDYLEAEGVYAETGYSYLFEYSDNTVHNSRAASLNSNSTDDILQAIEAQLELRTGRVDEVGFYQYVDELGASQSSGQAATADVSDILS